MVERRVYYIEDCNNTTKIKEGILIKTFRGEYGRKMATIREPIDKYRPEHFHDIRLCNIKEFVESDEIRFLNDFADRIHDRLDDLWCDLKDIY